MSEAAYKGGDDPDPPPPSYSGSEGAPGAGGAGEGGTRGGGSAPFTIDTTYPRSIEGILKIVTVIVAVIGLILTFVGFVGPGGWFIFVGFGYIVYVIIVFVIEMFLPGIYVHRLIDGIIVLSYGVLWALASIINLAYAAVFANIALGISVVFSVACSVLCVIQAIFAFRTWRTYEEGRKGSQPIIVF